MTDDHFNRIFPYETPRQNQRDIIQRIIRAYESGKRYVILDAPTGCGKSCIGYSVARHFGSSYILTSQKILQQQYYDDFSIPFVVGRQNYRCQKNGKLTCDMGACLRAPKRMCKDPAGNVTCPYMSARDDCFASSHSNLNYSYFLSVSRNGSLVNPRHVIICDEAHNLESELIKTCSLRITEKLLKYLELNVKMPQVIQSEDEKRNWVSTDFVQVVKSQYIYYTSQVSKLQKLKSTNEYKKISNKYSTLQNILMQVSSLQSQISEGQQIIITHDRDCLQFKPLYGKAIFRDCMQKFSGRFLFMSASILNSQTFIRNLGIDEGLVEYIRCESLFPVQNRLIHYTPVGSMSYRMKDKTIPKMIGRIQRILEQNPDVKGIIHTVSYDVAERILEGLSFSRQGKRLVMPKGNQRKMFLQLFYKSSDPLVLISPSLMQGIDLKQDLSRLCIICKVPYASLADKWVVERMKCDDQWYQTQACINLIQMSGRSIRSETDYANTYILDSDFIGLARKSVGIFPDWWKQSVVEN